MTTHRIALASTAALIVVLTCGAVAFAAKTITLSGSTSVAPLATQLAKEFVDQNPGKYKFVVSQGGSDIGITDASRGRVTLGMSSRDPKPADPGGIVFNKFARDGVCVITNPDNKVPSLSQSQIQDIFSGRLTSWSQVPGATVSGRIRLAIRNAASGTQDAFQNIFMGENLRVASSADEFTSQGLLAQTISSDPTAIGYASFAATKGVYSVPYQGVVCNLRTAKSGEYGGVRNFFLVSRGAAKGPAKKFIKFARTNKAAQKIISRNWVPLK